MTDQGSVPAQAASMTLETGMLYKPVMVYTPDRLTWGDIVINENMRVNILLSGTNVPDYISLYKSKQINLSFGFNNEPSSYAELHIPTNMIIGFHLMPPMTEPVDYDKDAPHRKMEPILAQIGQFNFMGHLRMSTQTNIKTFIEVTSSEFISLYDLEIVHATKTDMQPIKAPAAQVRRLAATINSRS